MPSPPSAERKRDIESYCAPNGNLVFMVRSLTQAAPYGKHDTVTGTLVGVGERLSRANSPLQELRSHNWCGSTARGTIHAGISETFGGTRWVISQNACHAGSGWEQALRRA